MIGVSPRQLEVFAAIAASGSVSAAATQVHLSQPATSMALAELERLLGAPLFDRSQQRLRLNDHGRRVLPLAREILDRLTELGRGAESSEQPRGELRLGASNTVGNYLVGDLLGGFVRSHPRVALRLHVDNTAAIVAGVLDYSLDLGCVEGDITHAELELLPWREDALCICAPAGHPLVARKTLRPGDFAGSRWILREAGSATRQQTERALAQLPPGETILELDQSEAIKQAVIAGLGLALLPAVAVQNAAATGRLAILPTPFLSLQRQLQFVIHRRKYRSALLQAFLNSTAPDREPPGQP